MALIAFSALVLSFFDARTNGWLISLVFMLLMAGNAFILTPLTTEGMNALPNKLIPHGSAMNSTMRQLFAAIGTAILTSLIGTKANVTLGFQFVYHLIAIFALIGLFLAYKLKKR